jgi:DNA-binding MarR family transcriptional regulator
MIPVMFDHCLYFNTTALARVVEKEWTSAFKPFRLTPPQGFMLRLILARPGLSQHELATELTISRPTATRLLDGLQALGLVERRDSVFDARHWSIFPSAAAEKIHAALNAASGQVTQKIQRTVGKDNFLQTVDKVREVCSALK